MIDINAILKKKITKFVIVVVIIVLAFVNYYKKNKEKVDEAIFLYGQMQKELQTGIKEQQEQKQDVVEDKKQDKDVVEEEEPILQKDKEKAKRTLFGRREKPTPWVDKNLEDFKEKQRRVEEARKKEEELKRRSEIMAKIKENKEKGINVVQIINEKNEFNVLLKKEYKRKKKAGKIKYGRKVQDNDYIYITMKPVSDDARLQQELNKIQDMYFVLKVDSTKPKSFNKKLHGKKINDTIKLRVEDFLSDEKIKMLNDLRNDTRVITQDYVKAYPYLKKAEYDKFVDKYLYYSFDIKIYDILDEAFVKNNDIGSKVFDYNLEE